MKKFYIFIVTFLLLCAIFNPDKSSFEAYVKNEFKSNSNDDLTIKIIKKITKFESQLTIKYSDRIFFSLVRTNIIGEEQEFLGILGKWLRI